MYLKRIESYGFKSFANRIVIEFERGMNAIVGPNGSGKSNIVDATRWVLGEQSAKTLRGGNMQDIIFKGSAKKKQLGYAEVSLILDNEDHELPIEYAEVSITRRLYRNGESLYMINNKKVRLQDVTNLFMDSGIGKESFSIIGQGRIDEILNSKPIERRAIFEETAGVLKYKTRKEQSIRKLEKTHDNLQRVTDLINELELQIEPLRRQSEVATLYLEQKQELQELEIDLLAYDIQNLLLQFKELKQVMDECTIELAKTGVEVNNSEQKLQFIELNIVEMDQKIAKLQDELLQVTQHAESVKGNKQLYLQKKEHLETLVQQTTNDTKSLDEKLLRIEQLENGSSKVGYDQKLSDLSQTKVQLQQNLQQATNTLNDSQTKKMQLLEQHNTMKSRFQTLKEIDDSHRNLFQGVKEVVVAAKNNKLNGIEGTLVDLIEVDQQHAKAIEVALGNALQYIVVKEQKHAEEAISYLKQNKLGRATFFPLNIIKGKPLEQEQLRKIQAINGVVDIANNLIECEPTYKTIILQLLGQTIIADTLSNANMIAKQINFRYRIVTLAGEIVHRGGSLTGGLNRNEKTGLLLQKKEIDSLTKQVTKNEVALETIDETIREEMHQCQHIQTELEELQTKHHQLEQQKQLFAQQLEQMLAQKSEIIQQKDSYQTRLEAYVQELSDLETSANELDDTYSEQNQLKENILAAINSLRRERVEIDTQKQQMQADLKAHEIAEKELQKQYQKLELQQNTLEIKTSDKIAKLQEQYECDYQTMETVELKDDYTVVETRVQTLNNSIARMGIVNIGAIEEFERVSERFNYLSEQKTDLLDAEDNLLAIIKEMDVEMEDRFAKTFTEIQHNFKETFKFMFGGGTAELKLEDDAEILASGIEIYAQPPGKKIQNLSLLSGGERALSAIALLFAILKTKPVPFCILDEVEAALDEANVDRFAKYLKTFSQDSQFIVVTHRKGTMEMADILYGVTMEEAGISKILSVKLQDANKYLD